MLDPQSNSITEMMLFLLPISTVSVTKYGQKAITRFQNLKERRNSRCKKINKIILADSFACHISGQLSLPDILTMWLF